MMEQRVSLITLGVDDIEKSAAFYQALGWKKAETQDPGIVAFDLLGQVLGLYPKENLARDMGLEPSELVGFSGITLAHNVRDKALVAQIHDLAVQAGARSIKPPHDVFWGGHIAYISDPDGHVWEIAFNPFSPPRADGSFQWGG